MFNKEKESKNILDPNDVQSVESGVIARLWRTIIHDLNTHLRLDYLAARAEKNQAQLLKSIDDKTEGNEYKASSATKFKTKAQFLKDATSDKMSFKIFVKLLRSLLGVVQFRLTIEITRATGHKSIHSTPLININGDGNVDIVDLEEVKEDDKEKEHVNTD